MKYLKYIIAIIIIGVLSFLLFNNAVTLIYIICSVLCTASVFAYVLIYYIKHIDETNEPKKIIVEGNMNLYRNFDSSEYIQILDSLKSYFENRYTICQVKIVYLMSYSLNEAIHEFYISTENHYDAKRIQDLIIQMFGNERLKLNFIEGLPTI